MKEQTEVERIRSIMGKGGDTPMALNLNGFTVPEKCHAICNWAQNSDAKFNTVFVEAVHESFNKWKKSTPKQIAALDKIITRFSIDIDRWSF